MNPVIRERFYGNGNQMHVDYIIRQGGMTAQEAQLFRMLHAGAEDDLVESTMAIDRRRRTALEQSVARKVATVILHALEYTMDWEELTR